jgi:CDP-6-deoxy-D-xylo-4-hexulose-3-dehydrase
MIPLMKNAFLNERETKEALCNFIMRAERLSMSTECASFERKFAVYQGRADAVLFNSGGSANLALIQALKNLGRLADNDKVGFSALTWATNVMPLIQLGLSPIPVDCDPATLNVMSENLNDTLRKEKITALFLTNALGFLGDIQEIGKICRMNNILLIEDNCESLGSVHNDIKAGNFGLASTFSFFVAHHMSTIEGGMVCTDDDELAEMLRMVRANGWDRNLTASRQQKLRAKNNIDSELAAKYSFYDLGFNLRPTEITGFLGNYQMQFLEENIRIRESNYLAIEKLVARNSDLVLLKHDHVQRLSTFAFPFLCKTPELRRKYLDKFSGAGIEIRPMIAGNMQSQPFYSKYVNVHCELPGTDFIHNNGFYFGNYPELSEMDLEVISGCLLVY